MSLYKPSLSPFKPSYTSKLVHEPSLLILSPLLLIIALKKMDAIFNNTVIDPSVVSQVIVVDFSGSSIFVSLPFELGGWGM